jgi:hypothetical protein
LPQEIGGLKLVNQAGDFLVSANPWKWLENVEFKTDLRGKVTVTGGTPGTQTLTKTDAFANYTFVDGDTYEATGGTNTLKGFYRVTGKTSAHAITLESDIVSAVSGTDQAGTLHTGAIALPTDFRDLIEINTSTGLLKGISLVTHSELLERRASSYTTTSGHYYATIVHAQSTGYESSTGAPTPRLEVWPTPGVNEADAMTIIYRAGWSAVTTDSELLRIPSFLELPYLEILRALARGFEEEDQGSVSQRLAGVMSGPLMMVAKDRDDMAQPHYGRLRNGAADSVVIGSSVSWDFTTQGAPTPPKHLR